jgi:hypothetical protein
VRHDFVSASVFAFLGTCSSLSMLSQYAADALRRMTLVSHCFPVRRKLGPHGFTLVSGLSPNALWNFAFVFHLSPTFLSFVSHLSLACVP